MSPLLNFMNDVTDYEGVSVVTIKADSKSMFPPLCQILGDFRYSPMGCTVHMGLMQSGVTAALGTIQIMVGLFNIGLGPGRTSVHPGDLTDLKAAYWLGTVYITAGIISLFAGRYPSACWVGFTAFVNIVGSIFAIVGIALYVIDLGDANLLWMCNSFGNYDSNCTHVAVLAQSLLTGMDITLIVLASLQLCVCISMAVLSITALVWGKKKEQVGGDFHQPVLKEVMTSPGA